MTKFGKIFVECYDRVSREWFLSSIPWWVYLKGRVTGVIGKENANPFKYDIRHVSRANIIFGED